MTAKDRPVSKPATDDYRTNFETIFGGKEPVAPEQTEPRWKFVHTYDSFFDFECELIDFPDEGNTSIEMRLSFNIEARYAYLVIFRCNDDGDTRELTATQINLTWEEGMRQLGDTPVPEGMK